MNIEIKAQRIMAAAYNEEKFKQHIRTVVSEAEGDSLTERPLTLDELRELAISMGMSDEEWDALQNKAHVHLKLAEDHLKARNFEQAIEDAEKATSINPYLPNGNSILAKAYHMLWLEDDFASARDKAEYYARKELLTDPDDTIAINVLSAINKKKKVGGKDDKSKKTYLIIGAVILAVVLIAYAVISSNNSTESNNAVEMNLISAEEDMISQLDLVENAIDRRNNMLPDMFGTVDGSHSDLNTLNSQIDNLTAKLDGATGSKRNQIEDELNQKIADAKNLVQAYGDKDNVETLLVQIEGAENRINFEKKAYNDAVKEYNKLVKMSKGEFPDYELQSYYNED
ncbi:MAG: LemA protein [Crocinitomix sp.]